MENSIFIEEEMFRDNLDNKLFAIIPKNMVINFEEVHGVYFQGNCSKKY